MLAATDGADNASSSPREIVLNLLRATDTESPFAFVLREQSYVRHLDGGAGRSACFPWSERVLEHLAAIQRERADPAAAAWLGEEMRSFLDRLGWGLDEESIRAALDAGRSVHLTLRLGAAELYALPWELVPLGATGRPLGSLPGFLLRYEWPDTRTARPAPDPPPEGGRILFAWSAAGGVIPADDHLATIRRACLEGRHLGFDRTRDVVPHASLGRLKHALDAGPVAVLHLLCHGAQLDAAGTAYGLVMDADDRSGREIVDARALQVALADHLGSLRLVVLCACHSGDSGALDSRLGSVAQALHRAGVPAVVASRYPLAVDASVALTEALYRGLLAQERSLLEAFLGARDRLRERARRAGWASLQVYARAADGPDLRPIVRRPYRGLLAFQEEHARYFFGREAEVEEALHDLSALVAAKDAAKPRFLLCTGASGTGKSSLVLAGVVPALRARDARWTVATLRPHEGWRASLQAALASRSDPGAPLLLVVDQLEEVFTMITAEAEREAFVRELWSLASHPASGVSVIATLRVDFLARCGDIQLWSGDRFLEDMAYDEAHRVFVRRMRPEHLRRVIEQPAGRVGLALEEGLVEQMLKDAGDEPGALPLLEYTLDQMWQQRRGRLLTWEQYNDLGGVGGALEKKADAILAGFDAVRRQAARRLLVQLVTLDGDARLDRRRRVPLDQLRRGSPVEAAVFDEVMHTLACERLLVLSGGDEGQGAKHQRGASEAQAAGGAAGGSPVVEVAHEQLIRSWGTLRGWVREDRQMLAELQQVDRWVEESKGYPDYVLDGDRLGHARALLARYAVDIGDAARELVLRSERAAQRKRRWAVGAAIAASVAAVAMGVLAIWAVAERDTARLAEDKAERQAQLAQTASEDATEQAGRAKSAEEAAKRRPSGRRTPRRKRWSRRRGRGAPRGKRCCRPGWRGVPRRKQSCRRSRRSSRPRGRGTPRWSPAPASSSRATSRHSRRRCSWP
ncbi:CHAT domain-containing protein [Sorangium sp. So ce1128]